MGLLMGGPVGAALGVLAGHLLDDKLAKSRRGGRPRNEPQRRNPPGGGPAPGPEPGAEPGSGKKKRASTVYHVEDTDPLAAGAKRCHADACLTRRAPATAAWWRPRLAKALWPMMPCLVVMVG